MVGKWTNPSNCSNLCLLILDSRKAGDARGRALRHVAPFLRFEAPWPNMYAFGGRHGREDWVGSNTVDTFDAWNERWVPLAQPMPRCRAGGAASSCPDGCLMVVGGYDERGMFKGLLAACDVYNPIRACWGRAAPLRCARWGHGCALLQGSIYAVGGVSWIDAQRQPVAQANSIEANATRACEVYCPQKTDWQSCSSLNIPRSGSRVAALGNRYLAAVAGSSDINSPSLQKTVEIFDRTRRMVPPCHTPRCS